MDALVRGEKVMLVGNQTTLGFDQARGYVCDVSSYWTKGLQTKWEGSTLLTMHTHFAP